MKTRQEVKAFTLIELLVVIGIIGILAAIALPVVFGVINRAREADARKKIEQLTIAIENFRNNFGMYPPDGAGINAALQDNGIGTLVEFLNGNGYLPSGYNPETEESGEELHEFDHLRPALNRTLLEFQSRDLALWTNGQAEFHDRWTPGEDSPELLDPWGNPYQYVRNLDDQNNLIDETELSTTARHLFVSGYGEPTPDPRERDGEVQPGRRKKFDLWSYGIDLFDTGDDITNWKN